MFKHTFLSFCLLLMTGTVFAQVTAPVTVDETPPTMKTDTIIDGARIFLTRTFIFGNDTLVIETGYKYNPKDFSFSYQELEQSVVVTLNKELLNKVNANHLPQVHAYSQLIGERITANAIDYLVLLGGEFYCDGKECANLFAMVVNTSTMQVLDINTGFCNGKEILKLINKRSKENDNIQVPVINDCKKEGPSEATWINVDKAL